MRFRIYFHPSHHFMSTLVYNESHFRAAATSRLSESTVFHVYTLCPSYSLFIRYTSSATIVLRKNAKSGAVLKKQYLRIHSNGFILNTGVTLNIVLLSDSLPARLKYKQKVWRVVLQTPSSIHCDEAPYVTGELGEEISAESSIMHGAHVARASYKLVECEENEYCDSKFVCGLRKPLFISRHVVCIESLIDRFMSVYTRTSNLFKGSVYRGSRDYETDVNHVDDRGVCHLVILCVSEFQVPLADGESTRNCFYLFQLQVLWSVFHGWKVGNKCRIIKELRPEVAFSPSSWYPYSRFPVEKDDYSYCIPTNSSAFSGALLFCSSYFNICASNYELFLYRLFLSLIDVGLL
ncbi:hypothetical protein GCK32_006380 [Trichostrongylus colubriformis]|uniref:Uncharacterized protein n=1 Tax=Trichostrongylus colubriformis TaxID=6319 RepID=A0AAN8J2R7_TRICO